MKIGRVFLSAAVLSALLSCGKAVKPTDDSALPDEIVDIKKAGSFPFYVYKDAYSKLNHFHPSGWMGDFDDMSYNNAWSKNPKAGKTCFRIRYSSRRSRGYGWAGIYWQEPINNWNVGKLKGGYDLTGAKKLRFYARGEKGGEIVEFQVGGMTAEMRTTGLLELSKNWNLYEIDVSSMDLSIVNGGFNAVYTVANNSNGCVFYIDEIYYTDQEDGSRALPPEKKPEPEPVVTSSSSESPKAGIEKMSYSEIQQLTVKEIIQKAREAVSARETDYARLLVREGLLKEPENRELLAIFTQLSKKPK